MLDFLFLLIDLLLLGGYLGQLGLRVLRAVRGRRVSPLAQSGLALPAALHRPVLVLLRAAGTLIVLLGREILLRVISLGLGSGLRRVVVARARVRLSGHYILPRAVL